jgi:hypothetical protein
MLLVAVDADIGFQVPNLSYELSSEYHENNIGGMAGLTIREQQACSVAAKLIEKFLDLPNELVMS